ncbi:MAG: recombinase family protein [Planctomycetota bacterium]|jgi:site-specific DNA recombinase
MAKTIAAVGYVRMSTDKQETSPEQQKQEIQAYAAKHGYSVLRWYADLGISGDKTEKRVQFQQMIADAEAGRFKAILCWDQDRFGRFDSLESGYWIHPLRKRGVQLITCTDGPVDWNTFAGRMLYGMKQEGKHQYLVDLSNNVTRRMWQLAQQGRWVCGAVPVGYRLDEDGKIQLGPAEDVQMVRMLFDQYAAGSTTRQLARMLSEKGYRSSKGKPWSVAGITGLLKKPMYAGHYTYGRHQFSKYQPRTKQGKYRAKDEWVTIPNNHPAIVPQELFDTVQRLLKERKRHTSPNGMATQFMLSGLLRCGHCGQALHGDTYNSCYHYTCSSYKTRPGSCERYNVRQEHVLPQLLEVLKDKLFRPAIIKQLRATMLQKLTQQPTATSHTQRLEAVDRKIEAAEHRLLEVSKDMIPRIEAQIRQLEQQRAEIQAADLPSTQPALSAAAVSERIDTAMQWFSKLERLASGKHSTPKLRAMLLQFIDKIELCFERKLWGKSTSRFKCEVVGGTIYFRVMGLAHIGPEMRDM